MKKKPAAVKEEIVEEEEVEVLVPADKEVDMDAAPEKVIVNPNDKDLSKTVFHNLINFEIPSDVSDMREAGFFDAVGLMNSHKYRGKLTGLMDEFNMDPDTRFIMIMLFSEVKSVSRVTSHLKATENLKDQEWAKSIVKFCTKHVVQYVRQATSAKKFPAVKIPESFPSVSLLGQIVLHPEAQPIEFIRNQFGCQFNLSDDMMKDQKQWEYDFWTKTVTRSNDSTDRDKSVELGFHESFWANKAADCYPLLDCDFKVVATPNKKIDLEFWINYINARKKEITAMR